KRQNDDYIEKENSKSCKVKDSGVKKQTEENKNNLLTQNEIMDLTPSLEFVLRYTDKDNYMQVLKETFESVDELFPESAIKFLDDFFSEEGYADHSDGLAYITTEKQYEIYVIEGSRLYVVDDTKEISDFVQNAKTGKDIINYTVVSEVKLKRAPPLQFKAYMVQCIRLSFRFYFMDYL
ncbi:18731_t:CDS:2, partial [Racocetra fulgida]